LTDILGYVCRRGDLDWVENMTETGFVNQSPVPTRRKTSRGNDLFSMTFPLTSSSLHITHWDCFLTGIPSDE
jgi:hypothetical protein